MSDTPLFKFALREDLINNKEFLPTKGEPDATGWDVSCAFKDEKQYPVEVKAGDWIKIPLGFRCFAPKGWWLELRPRSSTAAKKNLHALYGVIDTSYEGELIFCAQYLPHQLRYKISDPNVNNDLLLQFGEKIGQLIPVKRQEMIVEEISNEDFNDYCQTRGAQRGAGGFGSTSK